MIQERAKFQTFVRYFFSESTGRWHIQFEQYRTDLPGNKAAPVIRSVLAPLVIRQPFRRTNKRRYSKRQ